MQLSGYHHGNSSYAQLLYLHTTVLSLIKVELRGAKCIYDSTVSIQVL